MMDRHHHQVRWGRGNLIPPNNPTGFPYVCLVTAHGYSVPKDFLDYWIAFKICWCCMRGPGRVLNCGEGVVAATRPTEGYSSWHPSCTTKNPRSTQWCFYSPVQRPSIPDDHDPSTMRYDCWLGGHVMRSSPPSLTVTTLTSQFRSSLTSVPKDVQTSWKHSALTGTRGSS